MQTAPVWTGVVMVERPDSGKVAHVPFSDGPMCHVRSARTVELAGRRAIVTKLPYKMLAHYFESGDNDHVFVWAEAYDTNSPEGLHLELKEKGSIKDWANTAGPLGVAATRH